MSTKKKSVSKHSHFSPAVEKRIQKLLSQYPGLEYSDIEERILDQNWGFDLDNDGPLTLGDVDFTSIIDDLLETAVNDLEGEDNENCCALAEVAFSSLPDVEGFIIPALSQFAKNNRVCGLHLTEAYRTARTEATWPYAERVLNTVVTPVYLGVNPKTKNHVYSWTIPVSALGK